MHPAYSIIFFTAASGAGYGLLFVIALFAAPGLSPVGTGSGASGIALAFVLVSAGLVSSGLHLGHPERALKAFSQWRSSWLSREGLAALAAYPLAALFALDWLDGEAGGRLTVFALALAAVCIATVVCTGMIYASLKPIRRWHNGWVVPNYLALALMTGSLWLVAIEAVFGRVPPILAWSTATSVAVAWILKHAYWRVTDREADGPTAESATGLGNLGRVTLLDAPHTSDNYLLKEMGYTVARKHARRLRCVAVVGGFALPLALTLASLALPQGALAGLAAVAAALSASAGVLVERWLFFAEARHSVTLYYGAHDA